MHKHNSKSLGKKALSLLAASAVAYTQLISVIPIETIAADNDTAPDETYAEAILGDVNGDGITQVCHLKEPKRVLKV